MIMSTKVVHRCRSFDFTPCSVHCMTFSKISSDLAVARSDGSIEIWNCQNNWFIKLIIPGVEGRSVECLTWLANRLISGGLHGDITEYDLSTTSVKVSLDSYGGAVWCMTSSPNEDKIAVGCEDGSVKIFNTENKSIFYEKSFDKQEGRILSISWHEQDDVLVTGSVDVIRLWSTKTGRAVQRITIDRQFKNVETIVWCVQILRDFTIVSGDSSGRVQFWDGKKSSLLQSFNFHRADVLCMCAHSSGKSVFAAGVDPRVIEFSLINTASGELMWVKGDVVLKHTHDVRALTVGHNKIASGGVDTNIMTSCLNAKHANVQKINSFPSKSLTSYSVEQKVVMFQYSDKLVLWKLGEVAADTELTNCSSIPLEEKPIKLMEVRKPKSDLNQIVCSCISNCGKWIVYSTLQTVKIYRVDFNMVECKVNLQRVKCVGLIPSHAVCFTPDCKRLILSTIEHKIIIIEIDAETVEARLLHIFPAKSSDSVSNLLSTSSNSSYLGVADLQGHITVYDLTNMTEFCVLPNVPSVPTSMLFHPSLHSLFVVYDNLQVFEFSLNHLKYTEWTKQSHSKKNQSLLESIRTSSRSNKEVVNKMLHFQTQDGEEMYFVTKCGIYVVERTREGYFVENKERFFNKLGPLMFCEAIDANSLVVVERPMQDIWNQLPPTLYQKKFGT